MGACIGLIAAALHKRYVAETQLLSTGVSILQFQKNFPPRIAEKTTLYDQPKNGRPVEFKGDTNN